MVFLKKTKKLINEYTKEYTGIIKKEESLNKMNGNSLKRGILMTLIQTLKEDETKLDNYSIIFAILVMFLVTILVYFKAF